MLMSNGIQRNKAQEIASACQIHHIPYAQASQQIPTALTIKRDLSISFKYVMQRFKRISNSMRCVAVQFKKLSQDLKKERL